MSNIINLHKLLKTTFCTAVSIVLCSTLWVPKAKATTLRFTHVGAWEIIPGLGIYDWHYDWVAVDFWPQDLPITAVAGLLIQKGIEANSVLQGIGKKADGIHLKTDGNGIPRLAIGKEIAFDNTMFPDGSGFTTSTAGGTEFRLTFDTPIKVSQTDSMPTVNLSHYNITISSPLDFDAGPGRQVKTFVLADDGRAIEAGINTNHLTEHRVPEPVATPILIALSAMGAGTLFKYKQKLMERHLQAKVNGTSSNIDVIQHRRHPT